MERCQRLISSFDLFKLDDRGLKFTKHPNVNSFFPVSFFNDINFY